MTAWQKGAYQGEAGEAQAGGEGEGDAEPEQAAQDVCKRVGECLCFISRLK